MFNKILMDEVLPYKLTNLLVMTLIVFTVVAVTQLVIEFFRSWMMIFLSQRIDIPLMLGYFKHIYSLPMSFFSTRKTGDIITRFSDAFTIKDIFTSIALTLIMDIAMALITGAILFGMNKTLFAVIAVLTVISILLVLIFKQPYKKINLEQMQQASILNSQIIEGLGGVETIKGNANEETELDSIEREYIKSMRISYKEGMLSNIQGIISGAIETIGNLFLMYFGIKQVIEGEISLGSLMAFTTLSGYFMDPIGRLVGLQLQIQEASISMKRIAEILDYEKEEIEGSKDDIENIIFDMIYNKFRKKSMLIIAHRLATGRNCDMIIVLDKGEIIEQGSHEELLAMERTYYRLWQMQQGNFKIDEGTGGEAGSDGGTVNGNDVAGGTAGKTDFNNDEEDEDTISYT